MKSSAPFLAGILALGCCPGLPARAAAATPPAPPNSAPAYTDRQIITTWGWISAREQDLAGIQLSPDEFALFMRGAATGLSGGPSPCNLGKVYFDVQALAKARRAQHVLATTRQNEARAAAFFAKLKKNKNVFTLPSGIRAEILKPGAGPAPKPKQTVTLHYTGRLIDGTEFTQMGPDDAVFVPNRAVCRGWMEGIEKINKGGTIRLFIPPPLPEATAALMGIPPGSAMVFDVDLLDIKPTSPQDLADNLVGPPPEPPPPPPSGFPLPQIIETWGWISAQQTMMFKLRPTGAEQALFLHGLAAGITGQPAPADLRKIYPAVGEFVAKRQTAVARAVIQKRLDDSAALFASLQKRPGVVALPDGLYYEILKLGRGPHPRPNQRVTVNYTGRLLDGTVFDRSDPTIGPLDMDLDKVIPGWAEGVQKIGRDGVIKLYIPPELGYGDTDNSHVPGHSTVIYEIEVLDIRDIPPETPAPAQN